MLKLRGRRRGIAILTSEGETKMCILCDKGFPQNHAGSQLGRRDFLKASTATAAAAAGVGLFAARPAPAGDDHRPEDTREPGPASVLPGAAMVTKDTTPPTQREIP